MASLYAIWVPAVILAHILALILFLYSLKQVSIIPASGQPGLVCYMNCLLTKLTTSKIIDTYFLDAICVHPCCNTYCIQAGLTGLNIDSLILLRQLHLLHRQPRTPLSNTCSTCLAFFNAVLNGIVGIETIGITDTP